MGKEIFSKELSRARSAQMTITHFTLCPSRTPQCRNRKWTTPSCTSSCTWATRWRLRAERGRTDCQRGRALGRIAPVSET